MDVKPDAITIKVEINPEWRLQPANMEEQTYRAGLRMKLRKLAFLAELALQDEIEERIEEYKNG